MLRTNSATDTRLLDVGAVDRRTALKRSLTNGAFLVGAAFVVSDEEANAATQQVASTKTARFQELLRNGPFYSPLVENIMETRLAELAGLKHVTLSGNAAARAAGVPDLGLVSVTEVINIARIICDNTELPLLCDIDDGDGTALNIYRWVQMAERAGVAGILVEDCGRHTHLGEPHELLRARLGEAHDRMVTKEEMLDKVKAALDARYDSDFVVLAASVGMREGRSEQEALDRGLAYAEAGADMLWFSGMPTESTRKAVTLAKRPLLGLEMGDLGQLGEAGITMGVDAGAQNCAVAAIKMAFAELVQSGSTSSTAKQLSVPSEMFDELLGIRATHQRAQRYNLLKL